MAAKKILIVDDEPGFTQLMVEYFKAMGYDARSAGNADEGMALFKKHKPGVVILDFNMPLVTGDQFLPILQGMNPMVKAIVVSGCLEEEVEERFRGLGYFSFFEKATLSLEKLKLKVDEALSY